MFSIASLDSLSYRSLKCSVVSAFAHGIVSSRFSIGHSQLKGIHMASPISNLVLGLFNNPCSNLQLSNMHDIAQIPEQVKSDACVHTLLSRLFLKLKRFLVDQCAYCKAKHSLFFTVHHIIYADLIHGVSIVVLFAAFGLPFFIYTRSGEMAGRDMWNAVTEPFPCSHQLFSMNTNFASSILTILSRILE